MIAQEQPKVIAALQNRRSGQRVVRIHELDGLRCIAIGLVLLVHYQGFASLPPGMFKFGWCGVEIFFALSGYLITNILLQLKGRRHPYKTFYARRTVRIAPPYLLAGAFLVVGLYLHHERWDLYAIRHLVFVPTLEVGEFLRTVHAILHPLDALHHAPKLMMAAHHLPRPDTGMGAELRASAMTYWSLTVEEYFYLFWAPVVLACSRRWTIAVGLALCIVEPLLRFATFSHLTTFNFLLRFDALIYGGFVAILLDSQHPRAGATLKRWLRTACAISVAGLAAIALLIGPVLDREVRASPLFESVGLSLLSILFSCLVGFLVLAANSEWWLARLLRSRTAVTVGTISYGMYLYHMFAALAVQQVFRHFGRPMLLLQAVLSTALTILLARISWHYMEKPLLRWKDHRFRSPAPTEPALN